MPTDLEAWRVKRLERLKALDLPWWLRMLPLAWARAEKPVVDTVPQTWPATEPEQQGGAMRIYTDRNGVTVDAISAVGASDPEGHSYLVNHGGAVVAINFQVGPVKEYGLNGLSTEALLAICWHRLTLLNEGQFRCFQNAKAIASITDALGQLEDRAREREARGVLGTSQP